MYYLYDVGFFHTRQWFTDFDSKKYYANLGELETLLEKTPGVQKTDVSYQGKWYYYYPPKNHFIHVEKKDTQAPTEAQVLVPEVFWRDDWIKVFLYPAESLTAHPWKYLPNRKVVFQPPFFRGELLNFQWGNPSGWDPVGGLYGKKSWQWTVFFKCEEKCRVYRHHPQKIAGIFEVWWTISILSTWYNYIDVCCINRKRTWLECTWISVGQWSLQKLQSLKG